MKKVKILLAIIFCLFFALMLLNDYTDIFKGDTESIYNYTQSTIMDNIGYMILVSSALLVSAGVAVFCVYHIICRIRVQAKGSDNAPVKEYVLTAVALLIALAISISFLCVAVPEFPEYFSKLHKQSTGDCITVSGKVTVEVYPDDYRGTPLYYLAFNIDGEKICADNVFSEEEYKLLCDSLPFVQIKYIQSKPMILYYGEENQYKTNATILLINTIEE